VTDKANGTSRGSLARAKVMLASCIGLVVIASLAPSAEGHQIDRNKAQKVSFDFAWDVCKDDNTCYGIVVEVCKKPSAHVARCKVHYWGEDSAGPYDCEWIDQYRLSRNSNRATWSEKVFNDTFTCYADWGGHDEEPMRSGATGTGERADIRSLVPRSH